MITLDYERGWEGGKNCPNFDYVLRERPLIVIARDE